MKINEKFIENIFNKKEKVKNKSDKIKLSKFEDLIPMYDIYTQQIYPIKKENLFYRLTESNYRFLTHEVVKWIKQMYDKNKDKMLGLKKTKSDEKEQIENLIERLKTMIQIIDNYDIDTLIDNSYKILYQYSTSLGLSVSICKRNSFNPFIFYLKPYYTKIELIKLGQNMGIIGNDVKPEELVDIEKHYEVCKTISKNDVSFDEIKNHTISILNNKSIANIVFHSFIGSTLINRFLRNNTTYELNKFFYNQLIKTVNTIKNSPKLENDYQMYRFIADDDFLRSLKIGESFIDKGFISSTRDPFYSPGMTGNFGMVLIKININKGEHGLFIEHFSLFAKEEEFLLPPFTKLKLVSKNDNFTYYHINETFQKTIHKKYEFELISYDYNWIKKIKLIEPEIPELDFKYFDTNVNNKIDLLNKLKNSCNKFNEVNIKGKIFHAYYFDSSNAYNKFYYNKIEKGLSLLYFDKDGNLSLVIELGKEMIVNYMNQFYFYMNKEQLDEKLIIELVTDLGLKLSYKSAKIYNNFTNFNEFKTNYYSNQEIFLYLNHYDNTIYQYIKNKKKPYSFETFYKYKFRNLDSKLDVKLNSGDAVKFNFNGTIKELLIETIEKRFYQYSAIIKYFELEEFSYGELNIFEKLISQGRIETMLELAYSDEKEDDEIFKLVYRQPLRRN